MRERVYVRGNRFVVEVHPSLEYLLLPLPGANKSKAGITFPLNLISHHYLRDVEFLDWDKTAKDWWSEEQAIIEMGREVNYRNLEVWDQPDLWDWQSQAIARLGHGSVGLFDDRGMGKTRVVIEAIREAQSKGSRPAVIVTSKRLRNVWQGATGLWWAPDKAISPEGLTWSAAAEQIGRAPISIVTYESLMNDDVFKAIKKLDPHFLVLEEAHNLKKRHKKNKKKEKDAKGKEIEFKTDTKSGLVRSLPGAVRIAVSGTPMPNVWHEVWTLLNFVAPQVFTSYWQFVEGLGEVTVNFWGGKEISTDIRTPELWDQIFDRWIILRDRSGSRQTIWDFAPVELSKKEEAAYRQMQEEMRVELDGQTLDASNALAQAVRLQQLAGGLGEWETYEDENGRLKSTYQHARPSAKTEELLARLDGLDRAVVFTRFRNRAEFVAEIIEDELDCEVHLMVGGMAEKKQKELLERFSNPSLRNIVAVCVYGTISEGVNELVSSHDIFLMDWYTAKDAAQAVDRLDRPGQTKMVRATVLYAERTIEEAMIDRSSLRIIPVKEALRTPDAYQFLLNPIDRESGVE